MIAAGAVLELTFGDPEETPAAALAFFAVYGDEIEGKPARWAVDVRFRRTIRRCGIGVQRSPTIHPQGRFIGDIN